MRKINRKLYPLLIITCFQVFAISLTAQVKMVKTKIGENITFSIPEILTPMSDDDIISKYVSAKKPLAAYIDANRVVDFSINESISFWQSEDLELLKSFYKSSIQNLYDEIVIIREEIVEINKRPYVVFEFTSSIKGDGESIVNKSDINKYNFIQYTIVNGKTTLLNFSCPFRDRSYWKPLVDDMMSSIKISK